MTTHSKPAIYFYYENPAAKITRERAGYIRLQMQPGKQAAAIRAMFEQALLAAQVSGFRNLLLDHRLAAPFVEEAKEWFEHAFLPLMAADATVHRVAIVRAYDVFARLSMVPLSAGVYRQGNRFRTFESEAEALAWLLDDGPASSARS